MRHPDTVYRGWRYYPQDLVEDGPVPVVIRVEGTQSQALTLPGSLRPLQIQEGFEWGYHGGGPSALAFALLLDVSGDRRLAVRMFPWFRWAVVCHLGERWEMTAGSVLQWIARFEREERDDLLPAPHVVAEGGAA